MFMSNVKTKPSKPWIDEECRELIKERKKAERFNERHPSVPNSIRSKFLQARSRKIFRRKKRQTWRNYVSSITSKTKCKKVWAMVKKLTGKNIPKHMHPTDSMGLLANCSPQTRITTSGISPITTTATTASFGYCYGLPMILLSYCS